MMELVFACPLSCVMALAGWVLWRCNEGNEKKIVLVCVGGVMVSC